MASISAGLFFYRPKGGVIAGLVTAVIAGFCQASGPMATTSALAVEPAAPPRMDLYGDPLPPGAIARLGSVRFRYGYNIDLAVFSPRGKMLACGYADGVVIIWDATTGRKLQRLNGHVVDGPLPTPVTALAFSRDGTLLVSAADDLTIRVWKVATGMQLGKITIPVRSNPPPHPRAGLFPRSVRDYVRSVALSPDAKYVALITHFDPHRRGFGGNVNYVDDRLLRVWDLARTTDEPLFERPAAADDGAPVFSADSSALIVGSKLEPAIRVLDVKTGTEIRHLSGHSGPVTGVALSPDGGTLASVATDLSLRMWNLTTGTELWKVDRPNQSLAPERVWFTPDGKWLATLATTDKDQKVVALWNSDKGTAAEKLALPAEYRARYLSTSADLSACACHVGAVIVIFDPKTGAPRTKANGHLNSVVALSFSPDGRFVASGSYDGTLRCWEPQSGKQIWTSSNSNGDAAFSPDSATLAVGELFSGRVVLRDAATGRAGTALPVGMQDRSRLAFSPDGKKLFAATTSALALWNLLDAKPLWQAPLDLRGACIAYSPDGKSVAVCGGEAVPGQGPGEATWRPKVTVLSANSGAELAHAYCSRIYCIAYSKDGKTLVTTGAAATHWTVPELHENPNPLEYKIQNGRYPTISRDGRITAEIDENDRVVVRSPDTGKQLGVFPSEADREEELGVERTLAFSYDNSMLAVSNPAGDITIFDIKHIGLILAK